MNVYQSLVIFAAEYLIFLIAFLGFVGFLKIEASKKKHFFLFAFLTTLLSVLGAMILGSLYNNPRPFVIEDIKPLVSHSADNGFPSGHTLWSTLIAVFLFPFNKRLGVLLIVLAALVGLGRVLASVHHLVDIIASLTLVALVATLSWAAVSKFGKKFYS